MTDPGVSADGDPVIERSGAAAGMTAYILWGFITIYWKALADFAPLELVGYRISLSVILLAAVLARRGRVRPLLRRLNDERLWGRVLVTSVLLSVNWTTYVVVVVQGRVIEAALGYFICPLGTMLIGVRVLGERLRAAQKASAVLAFAAVVVLTVGYGRLPVYALTMAGTWAFYSLLKRQVPLPPVEGLLAETIVLFIPAVILVAAHLHSPDSVTQSADALHVVLVALTGVITAVPLLLFAYAAQHLPLTVLGPMQYSVPTINFLLGWLVYHETLTPSRMVGFGLVWAALAIVTIDSARRSRTTRAVGR